MKLASKQTAQVRDDGRGAFGYPKRNGANATDPKVRSEIVDRREKPPTIPEKKLNQLRKSDPLPEWQTKTEQEPNDKTPIAKKSNGGNQTFSLRCPDNVSLIVKDDILTIVVDLSKTCGLSSTGKSTIVGSTKGFIEVASGIVASLNVNKMGGK
jgi:hypothetical protein